MDKKVRKKGIIQIITIILYIIVHLQANSQLLDSITIHDLKEVVVQAQMQTTSPSSTTYTPTTKQKSAAQNAIDLLRQMAIPQITVNLVNQEVTTLSGSKISLFINYLPASSAEIEGLQTTDIRKVEYFDFPSDPRFNGSEHVVNIIIQPYEYGGYTKLSLAENFLTGFSNRASIYSKFAYKDMTFDLYAGSYNTNNHHNGKSSVSEYNLLDSSDKVFDVTRTETLKKSHYKNNEYPVSFRAVYETDNTLISNTIGFSFENTPIDYQNGFLNYSTNPMNNYNVFTKKKSVNRSLIWTGRYYFVLPHGFDFIITPGVTYNTNDYQYIYETNVQDATLIDNLSRETYYKLNLSTTLYKTLPRGHNIFLRLAGGTNHNDVHYRGSTYYDNNFYDHFASGTIGYNYTRNRFRVSVDAAIQWENNGINSFSVNEVYPLVNLSLAFSPSSQHSLNTYFHFGANFPGASVKSPNILQVNELLYQTGNPDLKLSRQISFNLQYNWIPSNKFSSSAFVEYLGEYGLFVPIYQYYNDGRALLKTYNTDEDYNRVKLGFSFNYRLLNGNLQLSAQPSLTIFKMSGLYDISYSPFSINASATYYLNNFYFQVSYQTPFKTIQGNNALNYRDNHSFYQLQGGWSKSGWNIRLSVINLFQSDWKSSIQTFYSPLYYDNQIGFGTQFHRRLNLSMTYTFNYGKKVIQQNEVSEQYDNQSAILK